MILEGSLPRPDHVAMTALEWERKATYRYVIEYIRPAMLSLGIPFTFVSRKKYATKQFFGGEDGQSVLLPVYTNQSGNASKLPEWCSGEWKRDVISRWAAEQPGWKHHGVNMWIGISRDEARRRRGARRLWINPTYPLLDTRPTTVAGCLMAVARAGWPDPPRSRCEHCPNQSDAEWAELTPEDFDGDSLRYGCIACPALSRDKVMDNAAKRDPRYVFLQAIYAIWRELYLPIHRLCAMRLKKPKPKRVGGVKGADGKITGGKIVRKKPYWKFCLGPIRMESRKLFFAKLMKIQRQSGIELVTREDAAFIRSCWRRGVYPKGWSAEHEAATPALLDKHQAPLFCGRVSLPLAVVSANTGRQCP